MKSHASMNRIYRLVWNHALGVMVAVAENAKGRGKSSTSRGLVAAAVALTGGLFLTPCAQAGPTGGQVSAGAGTIAQAGNTTTITQNSQNLAINWQGFNIAVNEAVRFNQPNTASVALNRVIGQNPSQILGSLSANGQVFVINPNGVLFGATAQVNVGGLVASTLGLSDADLMAGRYTFNSASGASNAGVVNQGTLTAAQGGYIALLAPEVRNEGVISATLGTALLAAGNKVTLNLNNGSLLGYSIDQGAINALADNKQLIQADGGQVFMSAKAADALSTAVVNNTGILQARTVQNVGGVIKLISDMETGTVNVGGTLDASAPNGGDGGFIETSAGKVKIADSAIITTLAATGKTGTWLIDPHDYKVDSVTNGGDITGAALGLRLDTNNVSILSSTDGANGTNGDVLVNQSVNWSANNKLTLSAQRNIDFTGGGSLNAIGATGSVELMAGLGSTGAIIGNAGTVAVTANSLTVTAKTGIGSTAPLLTNVRTAALTNTASGGIDVTNTGDITVAASSTNGAVVIKTADGGPDASGGNITVATVGPLVGIQTLLAGGVTLVAGSGGDGSNGSNVSNGGASSSGTGGNGNSGGNGGSITLNSALSGYGAVKLDAGKAGNGGGGGIGGRIQGVAGSGGSGGSGGSITLNAELTGQSTIALTAGMGGSGGSAPGTNFSALSGYGGNGGAGGSITLNTNAALTSQGAATLTGGAAGNGGNGGSGDFNGNTGKKGGNGGDGGNITLNAALAGQAAVALTAGRAGDGGGGGGSAGNGGSGGSGGSITLNAGLTGQAAIALNAGLAGSGGSGGDGIGTWGTGGNGGGGGSGGDITLNAALSGQGSVEFTAGVAGKGGNGGYAGTASSGGNGGNGGSGGNLTLNAALSGQGFVALSAGAAGSGGTGRKGNFAGYYVTNGSGGSGGTGGGITLNAELTGQSTIALTAGMGGSSGSATGPSASGTNGDGGYGGDGGDGGSIALNTNAALTGQGAARLTGGAAGNGGIGGGGSVYGYSGGKGGKGGNGGNITLNAALTKQSAVALTAGRAGDGGLGGDVAGNGGNGGSGGNLTLNAALSGQGFVALTAGLAGNGGTGSKNNWNGYKGIDGTSGNQGIIAGNDIAVTASDSVTFNSSIVPTYGSGVTIQAGAGINNGVGGAVLIKGANAVRLSNSINGLVSVDAGDAPVTVLALGIDSTSTQIVTTGDITLQGQINATSGGDAIRLAGRNFINNAGVNGLTASNGRYVVWSKTPENDVFGGLTSGNLALWGTAYGTANPTVTDQGNRFVFNSARIGIVSANHMSKTYGDAFDPATFTYTANAVAGSVYGNVFTDADGVSVMLAGTAPAMASTGAQASATRTGGVSGGATYDITVDLTGATAAGYTLQAAKGALTIAPRSLNLSGSRSYDGTSDIAGSNLMLSNVVNNDGASLVVSGTGTLGSKNAGIHQAVNATGLSLSGPAANNYTLAGGAAFADITQANLTVAAQAVVKTYDGTTAASGSGTVGTLVFGDSVNSAGYQAFLDKNVGNGKAVRASGVTVIDAGGTDMSANYAITYADNTASTINQASLVVAATQVSKTYDGTSAAAGNGTTTALVAGDSVNSAGNQAFLDKNVGNGKAVRASGVTVKDAGGTDMTANYAITYADNTASTITPASLTVTSNAATRLYGAANPALSGSVTGFVNGETVVSATTGNESYSTAAVATSNVGSYGVTGAGLSANNGNYVFVQAAGNASALEINPAHLTVTADNQARLYGAANPALTQTISGFVNGQSLATSGVSGAALATTAATGSTNVGSAAIVASTGTLAAGNYDFAASTSNGVLSIDKAHLTVTADNQTRLYGAANPALTQTISGFVNGQSLATSGVSGTALAMTAAKASTNVGSAAIVASTGGLSSGNYDFAASTTNGVLNIDKAHLTVTADNKIRLYGRSNPALTTTVSGFVNGEDATSASGFSGAGSASTPATASTPVGSAVITANAGTLAATNYDFSTLVNGALTVAAAPTSGLPPAVIQAITDVSGGNGANQLIAFQAAISAPVQMVTPLVTNLASPADLPAPIPVAVNSTPAANPDSPSPVSGSPNSPSLNPVNAPVLMQFGAVSIQNGGLQLPSDLLSTGLDQSPRANDQE